MSSLFCLSGIVSNGVDVLTQFPDNEQHRPSVLDLFLSSNPDICKVSSSAPLGNSDHVVVSVDVTLNSPSASESPNHRTLLSY